MVAAAVAESETQARLAQVVAAAAVVAAATAQGKVTV
jgi:hypothetical protein